MLDWLKRVIKRNDTKDEIAMPRDPERCCGTCDSLVGSDGIEGHCTYWHESHKLVDSCAAWHNDTDDSSNDTNAEDDCVNETKANHLPATRNVQPFRGYTSKPNPSMISTGDNNIDMHRFVSTQEAADELARRIRSEHEQRQNDMVNADGDGSDSDDNGDYQAEFKRLLDESDEYYSSLRRDPIDD